MESCNSSVILVYVSVYTAYKWARFLPKHLLVSFSQTESYCVFMYMHGLQGLLMPLCNYSGYTDSQSQPAGFLELLHLEGLSQ